MNEETEDNPIPGGIERALNTISRNLASQGTVVRNVSRNVSQATPEVRRLARTEERLVLPTARRTQNAVLELQRESVPRLRAQNNNIARDVNENNLQTERVRELLSQSILDNAECCEELTLQGDRNTNFIQNNLTLEFKAQLDVVKRNLTLQFNNVNNKITRKSNTTNNLIGGVKTTLVNNFNNLRVNLRVQFDNTTTEIRVNRTLISEVSGIIQTHVTTEIGFVLTAVRTAVTTLSFQINAVLTLSGTIEASLQAIAFQLGQFQFNINFDLAGIAAEIRAAQYFINRNVNKKTSNIERTVRKEVRDLDSDLSSELRKLSKKVDDLSEQQKEYFDKLPRRLGEVVSDYVIGESYYRWDATSTYFCTLIFKFKETDVNAYARVSQLKVRLKQRNEEITDSDIKDLRSRATSLEGLSYTYGRIRAYYVSSDKRFKTSLFSNSREDANHILTETLSYINDGFDSKNVSFTDKIERENKTSRKHSLDGVAINRYNYKVGIKQKLFKIVLLVNGISRPITIMQFKP